MFIRKFKISNFMIHQATTVELFPVTVFVGPNGGGKSALFDALVNFSMVSRGRLSEAFGPGPYSFASRRTRAASKTARMSYSADIAPSNNAPDCLTYGISYAQRSAASETPTYSIYDETLSDLNTGDVLFSRERDICKIIGIGDYVNEDTSVFAAIRRAYFSGHYDETNPLVTHCAREISRISKFRLDPTILARPSTLPETVTEEGQEVRAPRVDYRGEGLAGVLYFLAESKSDALDEVIRETASVVEGLEGFEFNTVGTDKIGFAARFSDSRGSVSAVNLSDGALSLIGLMVLLHSPDRPPVLCLEEPENGLTPRATQAVHEAVVAAAGKGGSQILMSSHSPYVICEAWNGEERDFIYQAKPEAGKAVVRPFASVIEEHGIQLSKVGNERKKLNLNVANEVMHGYLS